MRIAVKKTSAQKIVDDAAEIGKVLEFIQGISEIRNYNIVSQNSTRLVNAIERKTKADITAFRSKRYT